ncbi:MAG: hypothetical protein QOC63_1465 [Mycobacterium sp.]|jgi:hypothetical protein|nr:hypothetical protein [Mycobacterium sp.]
MTSVSTYRPASLLRCTSSSAARAGQLDRIREVDADLNDLGVRAQDGGQAGDESIGCEEPPAFAEVQPESSADLGAETGTLGGGRVRRCGVGEFQESVALKQVRAVFD